MRADQFADMMSQAPLPFGFGRKLSNIRSMDRLSKFHVPIFFKVKTVGGKTGGIPMKKRVWYVNFDQALEAVAMHVYHVKHDQVSEAPSRVEGAWRSEWDIMTAWFRRCRRSCVEKRNSLLNRSESNQTLMSSGSARPEVLDDSNNFCMEHWFAAHAITNLYLSKKKNQPSAQRRWSTSTRQLLEQAAHDGTELKRQATDSLEVKRQNTNSSVEDI